MKLVFTKLETPANEIKVSFDGVNYKSYNVDEIKTNGYIQFTEEECPDLTKVKIQGKFSTLGSVEVNKAIELERGEGGESGISYTFEKDVFEEKEVTYYCFAFDNNENSEVDDDEVEFCNHIWVKELTSNAILDAFVVYDVNSDQFIEGIPDTASSLVPFPKESLGMKKYYVELNEDKNKLTEFWTEEDDTEQIGDIHYLRYPEGDLVETETVKTGTETVTEVITEIQEEPTITENGQTIADEGKAFKSVKVNGVAELYKYSFDYGACWNNEVYSTVNKPFLEEGDLVMFIDGCWGGIGIWQLDRNEMRIPEFPKFVGFTSLAEIMRKNIAASNQPLTNN